MRHRIRCPALVGAVEVDPPRLRNPGVLMSKANGSGAYDRSTIPTRQRRRLSLGRRPSSHCRACMRNHQSHLSDAEKSHRQFPSYMVLDRWNFQSHGRPTFRPHLGPFSLQAAGRLPRPGKVWRQHVLDIAREHGM